MISSTKTSLKSAEEDFCRRYPQFERTRTLDQLRTTEYARLDRDGHIYLDYTGGGLYAESQLREHFRLLTHNTFGNPHSSNPTSLAMTERVESARRAILRYFNASPDEYMCIFVQNASAALKLVGESYPFMKGSRYLLTFDNHNSVNGIREFARCKGAEVVYTPILPPDLRIDAEKLRIHLDSIKPGTNNLFAFPAQSNFSGVQHSLDWIDVAHNKGWDVLLDGAALAPTNPLNLGAARPDFVSLSFYKIFGYPTGVGALLARKTALKKLHRPWFAGGTIEVASVQGDKYYFHEGPEAFEDGTLNYLSIPAVEIGLRHIESIGLDLIHTRVTALTSWLLSELTTLKHSNGRVLTRIYGPINTEARGGTITFNFYDPDGHFIDHQYVEHCANEVNISLRTGCFCNPGGGELALGISAEELTSCFIAHERMTFSEFRRCIDDKSTGAVRVSLGLVSTFADVWRFVEFARSFLDRRFDQGSQELKP
jgi:selenocysteine lyase/cysteine desulfurase